MATCRAARVIITDDDEGEVCEILAINARGSHAFTVFGDEGACPGLEVPLVLALFPNGEGVRIGEHWATTCLDPVLAVLRERAAAFTAAGLSVSTTTLD